jgi:hypothetical protein
MVKSPVDRLMDMCANHSDRIAELWYKALSANPKTASYKLMSKEGALRHAATFYKNLGKMYFSDDCFKTVEKVLDMDGFVEDYFTRGIPIEEALYILILLRRHIWTFADEEAIYAPILTDMFNAVESVNRILLVFDYASFIVARKYREFSAKTRTPQHHVNTIFPDLP